MKHLEEQNETYFEHFGKAFMFFATLFILSIVVLIHAIFPFWFTTTASCKLTELIAKMKRCNCDEEVDLSKCPNCGGEADNGYDRSYPPSAYWCTKCATFDGFVDE